MVRVRFCFAVAVLITCTMIYVYHTEINRKYRRTKTAKKHEFQIRPAINLLVAVMSGAWRYDRRKAIRSTWMKDCYAFNQSRNLDVQYINGSYISTNATCLFFTDGQDFLEPSLQADVNREKNEYKDLLHLPTTPGRKFGITFFHLILWIHEINTIPFDYVLRIDDDQFVCLDRLKKELPHRPQDNIYWGWFHCENKIVRADEGFSLFSGNLISNFYSRRNTLLCSRDMDQQVPIWLSTIPNVIYFYDNERIHHSVSANNPALKKSTELCHSFISLHGSYPPEMYAFWEIFTHERDKNESYSISDIEPFDKKCRWNPREMDWTIFGKPYFFVQIPCNDTAWNRVEERFIGRSGS